MYLLVGVGMLLLVARVALWVGVTIVNSLSDSYNKLPSKAAVYGALIAVLLVFCAFAPLSLANDEGVVGAFVATAFAIPAVITWLLYDLSVIKRRARLRRSRSR